MHLPCILSAIATLALLKKQLIYYVRPPMALRFLLPYVSIIQQQTGMPIYHGMILMRMAFF